MNPRSTSFKQLVDRVRLRLRWREELGGGVITLAVGGISLLIVALVASRFSHRPVLLSFIRWIPFLLLFVTGWAFVIRPLRKKIDDARIARLIEEKSGLADRLVTAVEYSTDARQASPAIVKRLIDDASNRASRVDLDSVVDRRRAYAYGAVAALILALAISMFFIGPKQVKGGMAALFSSPDAVSANAMFISVTPGSMKVPRGSDPKIKATLSGFDSSLAQVFIRNSDAENWVAQIMEPAKNAGEFQFVIFNIQDSASYYVEANGIRSPEFSLVVADLPFVKQIDLMLDFPAYTRLASKKIENGGEVVALKGTVVHVTAQMTAQAKSARIVISDGTKIEMNADAEDRFTAQFVVKQNGTYKIEITSDGGENYNGSNEYDITILEDHPPTVLIDKPGRDMKVTSIQEIFSQVRAEDDYGVSSIDLHYSVNGGEEKTVKLQDLQNESPHTLSGAHTFFLEELGLQPGDFISYYAKARDNSASPNESTSDIYFLEVRPFDRQFRQAQQQGGGGGGEDDSSGLTSRQRKIIASTFRVQRELTTYTPQEKDENLNAVTLSQEKLKTDTDAVAERIRRRLGDQLSSQPDFAKLVEYLAQASKEMTAAAGELRARKTKEAMPPEERALQQLLRAEAIFRDIQVARGQQASGSQSEQQDLADLFELQLDKMKNQYETVQREQQAQQNQQQDEIARRLEELARRQQQQVEQRMRSEMQQGGGGGGGSQRQQQEMVDEIKKIARELERLSRDRRDSKLAETAQQLQQAAEDMQRAQANSSSRNNSEATSQSQRALERLQQAQRMLESAQRAGSQQSVQKLKQQTEEALKRQDEITRGVEDLSRSGQNGQPNEQRKQQLTERKQALAEKMSGLERDIDQTARAMSGDREGTEKLRQAAGAIRNNRIPDRIRQNNQLIEAGAYDAAREREKIIRGNIEEVLKDLQAAEGGAGRRNQADSLEDALNRARELAENLESLRRRLESQQGQQGREGQQQSGQQQAGQQQNGQQQGGQQPQTGQQSQSRGQGQQRGQQSRGQQQGQQAGGQQSGQQQGQQAGGQQSQGQRQGQQAGGQQSGGRQQGQRQSGQQARAQQQGGQQQGGQQQGGQQQGGQQQGGQQQGGQQQGGRQQGGQQQGGQQQGGRQQGNPQSSAQAGGRPSGNADPQDSNGGGPISSTRQLESELRQRIAEAEDLKRALGRNPELARDLNRAIEQLRHINPNAFSDPAQLALLKNEVIEPLHQLEIELARKLQAKLGNNGAGAFSDGDAPERYRKMIEDYYRRLSARSPEAKP